MGDGAWIGDWGNTGESLEDWLATYEGFVLPNQYSLKQNYPNPFNPKTTIQFGLPVAEKVIISIYNLLGEKVAVLLNGHRDAGYHEITWNASNLPSGLYICQVKAGDFDSAVKLILLK